MSNHLNFTPLALLVSLFFVSCDSPDQATTEVTQASEVTTILLVRHAEKDSGEDPALTPRGQERAERLAFLLENEPVTAVYSTDYQRTQQTAAPTARAKGHTVTSYHPSDPAAFAQLLLREHAGETVLVVGHSNSTPTLANHLTGTEDYARFDESDYTNLYVVTVPPSGKPTVLKLRF